MPKEVIPSLQYRYCELRYDGDRTISGTALVYGDVAEFPWGEKERFEAGAFGSLATDDVILNVQHSRQMPIARTMGGGLDVIDSAQALEIKAVMPETTAANDMLALVKAKVLRGLSIEFYPEEYRIEGPDKEMMTITKAKLVGVGVVDKPAYPKSTLNPRFAHIFTGESR